MSLAICEYISHAHNGVASLRALLDASVKGLLDSRNVLVGYVGSLSGVLEFAGLVVTLQHCFSWLNVTNHTSVLARTSTLLLVEEVEMSLSSNRLTVVDSGVSNNEVNVVLTLHAFTVHEQMEFSHARNNDLFGLQVVINYKGRVFTLESSESLQELIQLVRLFVLDSERHDWVGHVHRLHGVLDRLVTEGLSTRTVNPKQSKNVSSTCFVDVFHLFRVHSDHARDLALLTSRSVHNHLTFSHLPLVNSNPSDLAERSLFQLKG